MLTNRRARILAGLAVSAVVIAACSSDSTVDESSPSADESTTTAPPEVLSILVTNDDGVGAEGIAEVVDALSALENTQVTVIAPAENQSASGSSSTDTDQLVASEAETATGVAATAVEGFPVDSVVYALDQGGMAEEPDLVVSGMNEGQNIAEVIEISGTVGAALAAVSRGIPALASSQGFGDPPDFEVGAEFVTEWVEQNRDDILDGSAELVVTNLNIPTCTSGAVRGVVEVDAAPLNLGRDLNPSDCTSTLQEPVDDLEAFVNGFVTISVVGTE